MLRVRLRNARKSCGYTQKQVAEGIGVTESTYCGYETGKREPDALKISHLAQFLGVSGDYLLGLDDEKRPAADSGGPNDGHKLLIDLFDRLDESQQAGIIAQLQALARLREGQDSRQ